MSATERFARAADAFRLWATEGRDGGSATARAALTHIAELCAAVLTLPDAEEGGSWPPDADVNDEEWRSVFVGCGRLPVRFYAVLFNPLAQPPESPATGDVADDIADIYRDVVSGLRAFDAGATDEAVWHWRFTFWSHWGRHATGAMGALREWVGDRTSW